MTRIFQNIYSPYICVVLNINIYWKYDRIVLSSQLALKVLNAFLLRIIAGVYFHVVKGFWTMLGFSKSKSRQLYGAYIHKATQWALHNEVKHLKAFINKQMKE